MQHTRTVGFTLVELIIVIVVIGVLAAIVMVVFPATQAQARDAQRTSDIKTIVKALEQFHALNGHYPNTTQMLDANFRSDTLQLEDEAVKAPGNTTTIGYCWANNSTGTTRYCYVPYRRSGGDCTSAALPTECWRYTLSYRLESNVGTQTCYPSEPCIRVESLNQN